MEIPKEMQKLLNKRFEYAIALMDVCAQVDDWLDRHGADLSDPDLADGVLTSCMIYMEPGTAQRIVKDYIRNNMNDGVQP